MHLTLLASLLLAIFNLNIFEIISELINNSDIRKDLLFKTTFNRPRGIYIDSGDVYITDTYNNAIRKMDRFGNNLSTVFMNKMSLSGNSSVEFLKTTETNSLLKQPSSITFDSMSNIYIADSGNNCIRRVEYKKNVVTTLVKGFL
jgi:hypothetical protein